MTSKKDRINMLKEKVGLMQRDLNALEKRSSKLTALPQFLKPVHKITHCQAKHRLSQTQKDITFIFKETEKFFGKEESQGQIERSRDKMKTERSLSPVLKDISNRIDSSYYVHKPPAIDKENLISSESPRSFFHTSFLGRRYAYNEFGKGRGDTSKQTKRKTFEVKKTDTVLNPQKEKDTGIKIVHKIQKSPENMLQENPKSNTKLYIFADKPVYMWRKASIGDKNKSSLVNSKSKGQVMPAACANSLEKANKTQKRHFSRYIEDIYSPRPQLGF